MRLIVSSVCLLAALALFAGCNSRSTRATTPGGAEKPPASHAPAPSLGPGYYVDRQHGDDAADGRTPATAFATIGRAADAAQAGDTVRVAAGTYRETVRPSNSGRADAPIVFQAEGAAVVDGSDVVTGWTHHRGDIWVAPLSGTFTSVCNQAEQLFWNGTMLTWARSPNTSLDPLMPAMLTVKTAKQVSQRPGWATWDITADGLNDPPETWRDGQVWILPRDHNGGGWGFGMSGPIKAYSPGTVRIEVPTAQYNTLCMKVGFNDPFYLQGALPALDHPGEWYHDLTAGRLYVWLPDGGDPNQAVVAVKRRDFAFDLSNRSHIAIRGFGIFGATITTDADAGRGLGGGATAVNDMHRSGDPKAKVSGLANSANVLIEGIDARYISHFTDQSGYHHAQWLQSSGIILSGRGHTLRDSRIAWSAGNGVCLMGPDMLVENNLIHDIDYNAALAAGVMLGLHNEKPEYHFARDAIIRGNTICNTGFDAVEGAILVSSDRATPARIHNNLLHHGSLRTMDAGGVRFVHFSIDANGTRIDHNVVHDYLSNIANGIYLDFSRGYVVDHNIVWDCYNGINLNGGQDGKLTGRHRVANNTALGVASAIGGGGMLNDSELLDNVANFKLTQPTNGACRVAGNVVDAAAADFVAATRRDYRPVPGSRLTTAGAGGAHAGALAPGEAMFPVGSKLQMTLPAPTGLAAVVSSELVHLTWRTTGRSPLGYVIERGYEWRSNGCWDVPDKAGILFEYAGCTGPDGTAFTDVVAKPARPYRYRVRAIGGPYSETIVVNAGRSPANTITFEADQGYKPGLVENQGTWTHNSWQLGPVRTVAVGADPGGGQRLVVTNGEHTLCLGSLNTMERSFDPAGSRIAFSVDLGLKAIDPSEPNRNRNGVKVSLGGVEAWGLVNYAMSLALTCQGNLWGWDGSGWFSFGVVTNSARVAGILDLGTGLVTDVTVNGVKIADRRVPDRKLRRHPMNFQWLLWGVNGECNDTVREGYVDNLSLRLADKPTVALGAGGGQLFRGAPATVTVARDLTDGRPLRVRIGRSGSIPAAAVRLLDEAGQPLAGDEVVIPGGSRVAAFQVLVGGDVHTGDVRFAIVPADHYTADPHPAFAAVRLALPGT